MDVSELTIEQVTSELRAAQIDMEPVRNQLKTILILHRLERTTHRQNILLRRENASLRIQLGIAENTIKVLKESK